MSAASTGAFPYRHNSLNLFRLLLAALVLVAHAYYIAGVGSGPSFNGENLGGWAVAGFFVISGFLITRSRFRTRAGDYLLHRVARIFPAYLVCLIVTAVVFAPLALMIKQGNLGGLLSTAPNPLEYVWSNITLYIRVYGIGTTLSGVPYPDVWNGSLWTLYFEFLCYVITWLLGALAIYRRSIVAVGTVWVGSVVVRAITVLWTTGGLDNDFFQFARLFSFFAAGALAYMIIDRWGLNRWIGLASVPLAAVCIVFVPDIGGQLGAPLLAYALLYLSTVIPQPGWIARNDVSYGFYIYAWPVQQLSYLAGGMKLGFWPYVAMTVVVTFVFAWASWVLVERPAMARVRPRAVRAGDIQAPTAPPPA